MCDILAEKIDEVTAVKFVTITKHACQGFTQGVVFDPASVMEAMKDFDIHWLTRPNDLRSNKR